MANGPDRITLPGAVPARPSSGLNRAVEYLVNSNRIGQYRQRPTDSPELVSLRSNEIFSRLVGLYTDLFTCSWAYMKQAAPGGKVPTGFNTRQRYMATIYISAWFWDLYTTIRECVRQLSSITFSDHFQHELCPIAGRFDPFLQHLNTIIRPTLIQGTFKDSLFIPAIGTKYNWDHETSNYFGIAGFKIDENTLESLLQMMERSGNPWSTIPLGTDTHERPGWLFDYRLGLAYAWFPMKSNYSLEDLTALYILGIPFTPRLGPFDCGCWQFYSGAELAGLDVNTVQRVARSFQGNVEYRTVEFRHTNLTTGVTVSGAKRPRTTTTTPEQSAPGQGPEGADAGMPVNGIRLFEWVYHARVTHDKNDQARRKSLHTILFSAATPNRSALRHCD